MILSRFFLNGASREVQRCLGDAHQLHVRILSMFPGANGAPARSTFGVLHRLEVSEGEGTITLLLQSHDAPDITKLGTGFLDPRAPEPTSSKSLQPLLDAVTTGARFRFRLRANPSRKVNTKTRPDGAKSNGRRVPLRGDELRLSWLARHLAAAGLRLVGDGPLVRQRPDGITHGRKDARTITHEAHVFDGVVEVVDPTAARQALEKGVGPGKSYGLGLLSLAPE